MGRDTEQAVIATVLTEHGVLDAVVARALGESATKIVEDLVPTVEAAGFTEEQARVMLRRAVRKVCRDFSEEE